MAITIGARPATLDGCWKTWQEEDVDMVIRTDMESGAVKTRRRFTGHGRVITASVTLPAKLYNDFMVNWFRINQRQGAIATKVVTPQGNEETVQWTAPPKINWIDKNAFTATVTMQTGAWY